MATLVLGILAVHATGVFLLAWGWHRAERRDPSRTAASPDGTQPDDVLPPDEVPPVSLVVAIRDEADALPHLLNALAQQTHLRAEIILVDDASTDDTPTHLQEWTDARDNARLVHVTDPAPPRKKNALVRGIAAASHDLLAFTDADCTPPPDWLLTLARSHAATERDTVLVGYSPMKGRGVLGAWARYETLLTGIYAAAATGLRQPYLAVGRNLSYPRAVFERVRGFDTSTMSGDDDLFVQAVHREDAADVRAVLHPDTFVPTTAPDTWSAWIHQKRRHVSTGWSYSFIPAAAMTLLNTASVWIWATPLLSDLGLGVLATGVLLRQVLLGPAAETLRETSLLTLYPLGEAAYGLYHALLVPFGLLRPPDRWSSATPKASPPSEAPPSPETSAPSEAAASSP